MAGDVATQRIPAAAGPRCRRLPGRGGTGTPGDGGRGRAWGMTKSSKPRVALALADLGAARGGGTPLPAIILDGTPLPAVALDPAIIRVGTPLPAIVVGPIVLHP
jgi:hypothetical protein